MRRSKLETYVDILQILVSRQPMKLTQLMQKIAISQSALKQHLDFLIQQNLVEEQNMGKEDVFYVITERGLRVLRVVVPIIEEVNRIPASPY